MKHAVNPPPPNVSPGRILDIASGYEPALILEAGVRLKIFDLLAKGPLDLMGVVKAADMAPRGAKAILNALVAMELLGKTGEMYALTEESAGYLVSTSPWYQGYMCKHVSRHLLPRWMKVTEVAQTGKPVGVVNEQADGGDYFREFVEDIFPMSYEAAQGLAKHLRVAQSETTIRVLDLAAGSGVWSIALAEASTKVSVTAVDWPIVLPVTQKVAEKHHVAGQFTFVAGGIEEADFGIGHHIATLGHIIHSEGEEKSQSLIRKTFEALAPGGTIVIAEFIADEDRTGPVGALIFAVTMLVNTEAGDTFTYGEMSTWLLRAGFKDVRLLDVPGPAPLILATKPL